MEKEHKEHKVPIRVGSGGKFSYDGQEKIEAYWNDDVHWDCETVNFALNFGENSPVEIKRIFSPNGKIKTKVRADAKEGTYKYSVAVFMDNGQILVDDPELIIKRP
jgi:hypothetical protein